MKLLHYKKQSSKILLYTEEGVEKLFIEYNYIHHMDDHSVKWWNKFFHRETSEEFANIERTNEIYSEYYMLQKAGDCGIYPSGIDKDAAIELFEKTFEKYKTSNLSK